MNNLEWIDKQILLVKENIQYHKDLLAESEEEYTDEIISVIKLLEPELQILQQIKIELEAWEVVKNKCVDMHDIIYCSNLEVYNTLLYKEYQLTEKEYKIIKKALEGKE